MSSEKRPQGAARRAAEEIATDTRIVGIQDRPTPWPYTDWLAEKIQRAIDASLPPATQGFKEWWLTRPWNDTALLHGLMGTKNEVEAQLEMRKARAAFEAGAASARGAGWVTREDVMVVHWPSAINKVLPVDVGSPEEKVIDALTDALDESLHPEPPTP